MPLKRKTPLRAKTPLKRTPFVRRQNKMIKKSSSNEFSSLVRKLDEVFSKYIRLRDSNKDGTFTCISCGRRLPIEQAQCGHYYPRANMNTRFSEDNCHAECVFDNCFNKDHLKGYFSNLLMKIGQDRLWQLDQKAKQSKKWSHYELEELISYYREKIKKIK